MLRLDPLAPASATTPPWGVSVTVAVAVERDGIQISCGDTVNRTPGSVCTCSERPLLAVRPSPAAETTTVPGSCCSCGRSRERQRLAACAYACRRCLWIGGPLRRDARREAAHRIADAAVEGPTGGRREADLNGRTAHNGDRYRCRVQGQSGQWRHRERVSHCLYSRAVCRRDDDVLCAACSRGACGHSHGSSCARQDGRWTNASRHSAWRRRR